MNANVWLVIAVAALIRVGFSAQVGATIEGVVWDATVNAPLAGAQVTLYPAEAPVVLNLLETLASPPQTTTDTEGRFVIQTRQTGRFRLTASKAGFIFHRSQETRVPQLPGAWVQLSDSTRIEGLQLNMTRPAVISGIVVDANGQPGLALVGLLRYTFGKDGRRLLDDVPGVNYRGGGSWLTTDDRGQFRLYDLPSGEYYLGFLTGPANMTMIDPGVWYYPGVTDEAQALPIQVKGGDEIRIGALTSPFRGSVELRLRITGPPGRPLNAQVALGNLGSPAKSKSNSGEYAVQAAPGHYDIWVSDSGPFRDAYYERLSVDVGPSNIVYDVVLQRAPHLTGTMVLEDAAGERRPAPPSIRCRLDGRSNLDCLQSQPEQGSYDLEFQGLPPEPTFSRLRLATRTFWLRA